MSDSPVLPAEWAHQSAVMLTWPHRGTDWCELLDQVEPVFGAIARAILRHQHLLISCEDAVQLTRVSTELNDWAAHNRVPGRVSAWQAPADDTWVRDHGPVTVMRDGKAELLDFRFNAWGGKFPCEKDDSLNLRLAEQGAFQDTPLRPVDFILEGGSLESDGAGTLLTTSECLLTTTRNPDYDRAAIEAILGEVLGVRRVLWLNHGYLAGDDTDSHIDTLARFCSPGQIAYVRCDDAQDEHYPALCAMEEELQQFRQGNGEPYQLTPLPWPDAIFDKDGQRLPATYANFLVINGAVLVPTYDLPQDNLAVATLAGLFPEREVIGIPCRPLITQHGSLHCVTMQLPAGVVSP